MTVALELVAHARGWSIEHAAQCTTSNALRFLRAGGFVESAAASRGDAASRGARRKLP